MKEYEPIIIKVKENGLLDIDEDKLKELLRDAFAIGYNEGYIEGSKSYAPMPTLTSPYGSYKIEPINIPPTEIGDPPDWYKFGPTCTSAINTNVRSDENAN